MQIINGHKIYDEQDIVSMLYRLNYVTETHRRYMADTIINKGLDIDTSAILNIISDPVEYNIDYLYSLDSAVTDRFLECMEMFGMI